jgi:hypothetical protein
MYMCPVANGFRDTAVLLYSSKIVYIYYYYYYYYYYYISGVKLSPLGTAATTGLCTSPR